MPSKMLCFILLLNCVPLFNYTRLLVTGRRPSRRIAPYPGPDSLDKDDVNA